MDPNTPNQGQPSQPGFPPYGSLPPDPTSDRPFSAPAPPPVSGQPASGSGFPAYPPPGSLGSSGRRGRLGHPRRAARAARAAWAVRGAARRAAGAVRGAAGAVRGAARAVRGAAAAEEGRRRSRHRRDPGRDRAAVAVWRNRGGSIPDLPRQQADADNISDSTDDHIDGLIDYRTQSPSALTRDHQTGKVTYPMSPPAGGNHNARWQNCEGDVYESPSPTSGRCTASSTAPSG